MMMRSTFFFGGLRVGGRPVTQGQENRKSEYYRYFSSIHLTVLLLDRHCPYGPDRDHHGRLSASIEAQADGFKTVLFVTTIRTNLYENGHSQNVRSCFLQLFLSQCH